MDLFFNDLYKLLKIKQNQKDPTNGRIDGSHKNDTPKLSFWRSAVSARGSLIWDCDVLFVFSILSQDVSWLSRYQPCESKQTQTARVHTQPHIPTLELHTKYTRAATPVHQPCSPFLFNSLPTYFPADVPKKLWLCRVVT